MIKWPITYTDYNGDTHTEEFYFNLNKAEVMEMNLNANGAYAEYLKRIIEQRDGKQIASTFKNLILNSYGEKSADGRRFVKSEEMSREFEQTEAFSELYMQLASDPDVAAKFMEGILPKIETSDDKPVAENHMTVI